MGERRVMVVDDERPILAATVEMLRELGYASEGVGDAKEIVPAALAFQPHVVLQDVRMPGLDLAAVVGELRSRAPQTSIVLFSAGMEVEDIARDLKVGFIEKPFKPEALVAAVEPAPAASRASHLER